MCGLWLFLSLHFAIRLVGVRRGVWTRERPFRVWAMLGWVILRSILSRTRQTRYGCPISFAAIFRSAMNWL